MVIDVFPPCIDYNSTIEKTNDHQCLKHYLSIHSSLVLLSFLSLDWIKNDVSKARQFEQMILLFHCYAIILNNDIRSG